MMDFCRLLYGIDAQLLSLSPFQHVLDLSLVISVEIDVISQGKRVATSRVAEYEAWSLKRTRCRTEDR
jgi:hypothetical protein